MFRIARFTLGGTSTVALASRSSARGSCAAPLACARRSWSCSSTGSTAASVSRFFTGASRTGCSSASESSPPPPAHVAVAAAAARALPPPLGRAGAAGLPFLVEALPFGALVDELAAAPDAP